MGSNIIPGIWASELARFDGICADLHWKIFMKAEAANRELDAGDCS
jgi:hypothetical protein